MKIQQSTQAWHLWRHSGIGSSDIATIMGESPYSTPLQLYEQKILPEPPENKPNYIQEKGHAMEPIARAHFELLRGKSYPPALLQMAAFPWMKSSLDGRSEDKIELAEFKYTGKQIHLDAFGGKIPRHHMLQVQGQLLVSGAERCYYVTFDGKTINVVDVLPDFPLQDQIFKACDKFWNGHVIPRKPPEPTDRDFVKLKINVAELQKWKQLRIQIAELEKEKDRIEEWAKAQVTEKRMIASDGTKFVRIDRVGAVDYGRIEILKGIDLEKYRKPGTSYIKMG